MGQDVLHVEVGNEGGGECVRPKGPRTVDACTALAGYLAVALIAPDADHHFRSWAVCHHDLSLFYARKPKRLTFRQTRRAVLDLLSDRRQQVINLANLLYEHGRVDCNTPGVDRI
jgi:hypothetical protein